MIIKIKPPISIKILFVFFFLFSKYSIAQKNSKELIKIADSLYLISLYEKAHEYYLKALNTSEKLNEQSISLKANLGIAKCHYYLYDHDAALKWFYNHLSSVKKHKADSLLPLAYYYVGVMYNEKEIIDSALKYSFLAIDLMKTQKDYKNLSRIYSTLAELEINTKREIKSIETFLSEALKYGKLSNNKNMLAFAYMKYYNYYFRLKKDYKQALIYISEAENLFEDEGDREAILNAYRAKTECLIKLGDTNAYNYIDKWFSFKDSVLNHDKAKNIAFYETIYETEKKENQIKFQNEIIKKEKQHKWLYIIISIILIILIVISIIFLKNKQKHKTQILIKEQNEKTVKEIFNAEQKERIRIARDLHDSIGQKLSVIKMILPESRGNKDLEKIRKFVDETADEVRNISHNLIPEILNLGLIKAINDLADKINASEKINIELITENITNDLNLPKQTEISIYRIIQEILSNIVKHSKTKSIVIDLKLINDMFQINIQDNGIGFDTKEINNSQGIGWKNIFARIELINGKIDIQSEKNKGSNFFINIPLA